MSLKRFKRVIAAVLSMVMLMSLGITTSAADPPPELDYAAHVQNIGWMDAVQAPKEAGTTGRALRMEALEIDVRGLPAGSTFVGRWHVQNVGWQGANADGTGCRAPVNGILDVGTTGQGLRLEAVQFNASVPGYTLWYRVHVATIGWMSWVSNDTIAGTTGRSLAIEAIQFELKPVGQVIPTPELDYAAHVQDIGWMNAVQAPAQAGTTGRALRMEALEIDVRGLPAGSTFAGRWHVQNVGWQGANADGTGYRDPVNGILDVGTTGQGLRLEAVQFNASVPGYTLWYRVHVANIGWMDWVSSGTVAGTTGKSLAIEAIQFELR